MSFSPYDMIGLIPVIFGVCFCLVISYMACLLILTMRLRSIRPHANELGMRIPFPSPMTAGGAMSVLFGSVRERLAQESPRDASLIDLVRVLFAIALTSMMVFFASMSYAIFGYSL